MSCDERAWTAKSSDLQPEGIEVLEWEHEMLRCSFHSTSHF